MKKTYLSTFGFVFLVFTAAVWAAPVSDNGPIWENITDPCKATIDDSLVLKIPYITYFDPSFGNITVGADFVYEFNPTSIIFKLKNDSVIIKFPSFLCVSATLSNILTIYIPDLLLPDGVTRMWVYLTYSPTLSINGKFYWIVSSYGFI